MGKEIVPYLTDEQIQAALRYAAWLAADHTLPAS